MISVLLMAEVDAGAAIDGGDSSAIDLRGFSGGGDVQAECAVALCVADAAGDLCGDCAGVLAAEAAAERGFFRILIGGVILVLVGVQVVRKSDAGAG